MILIQMFRVGDLVKWRKWDPTDPSYRVAVVVHKNFLTIDVLWSDGSSEIDRYLGIDCVEHI